MVVAIAGILAFLITVWLVIAAWRSRDPEAVYICAAFWAVAPPVWFWCEYFFLYRKYGNPDTLELFKHGQQVAVAIWAGVTISLAAFTASAHFKNVEKGQEASSVTQPSKELHQR